MPGRDPASAVLARCRDQGFALAGVCDAGPIERADVLRRWLTEGRHGQMQWIESHADTRADPALVLPGAVSAVMVADLVDSRGTAPAEPLPGKGRVARYAQGRDYHRVMKKRLITICNELREQHPGAEFRPFVDTAPVMERDLAARAGLGWIGKHTLLIHPRLGSHLLLGGFLTTLDLGPSPAPEPDHCGGCTRCIDACPTGAITPYAVDARRCISYLTIEHKGPVDPELAARVQDWVFGCDVCQNVCPHNSPRPDDVDTGAPHEAYASRRTHLDLLEMLGWDEDNRRAVTHTSSMKRAKLDQFVRNATTAAANDVSITKE